MNLLNRPAGFQGHSGFLDRTQSTQSYGWTLVIFAMSFACPHRDSQSCSHRGLRCIFCNNHQAPLSLSDGSLADDLVVSMATFVLLPFPSQ